MMKNNLSNYLILKFILVFLYFFCHICIHSQNVHYKKYKTFDEYILKGIGNNSDVDNTFVSVQIKKDTVCTTIFQNNLPHPTICYINMGKFWYSIEKKVDEHFYNSSAHCVIKEKYIYNSFIMTYQYQMDKRFDYADQEDRTYLYNELLTIETKGKKIDIFIDGGKNNIDIEENPLKRFEKLTYLIKNYSLIFPEATGESILNNLQFYQVYDKVFKGDTLFIYKNHDKNQSLYDVRLLNSLGEFDPKKGKSIKKEFKQLGRDNRSNVSDRR